MDLNYSPEERAFRDEVRGWLDANGVAAEVEVVAPAETAVAQVEVAAAEEPPQTPAPIAEAVDAPPAKPAAKRKRADDNQISLLPE